MPKVQPVYLEDTFRVASDDDIPLTGPMREADAQAFLGLLEAVDSCFLIIAAAARRGRPGAAKVKQIVRTIYQAAMKSGGVSDEKSIKNLTKPAI
jgi:hypothetical protein